MVLALAAGVNFAADAQEAGKHKEFKKVTPEQRAEKQASRMQEALKLTDAQRQAIYELNLSTGKEMRAMKQADRAASKEKFQAMRQQKEAKMKSILSESQYVQFQQMKAERMKKMQAKRAEWKAKKGEGRPHATPTKQDKATR